MKQTVFGRSRLCLVTALTGTALALVACGGGGSKKKSGADGGGGSELDEGASINLSGKLSLQGAATSLALYRTLHPTGANLLGADRLPAAPFSALNLDTPALTDLKIYCVTFSSPPVAGEGSVDAEGRFALTLAAAQQAVGCFILLDEEQLGTIVFKDPNKKSMSGDARTSQRSAFSGNTDFGDIVFDLTTGEAVVDVSQITTTKNTDAANAVESAYDFSGGYTIADAGIDLPSGYSAPCPAGSHSQQGSDCRGPEAGETIWVKRLAGQFIAGGSPAYGIMIWQSEDKFNQCGGVLGTSYQKIKDEAGVDLSGSGVPEGSYTFAQGWGDGWKSPTAALKWPQVKMERTTIGGYEGNKQYFKSYQSCTWNQGTQSVDCTNTAATGYSFWAQSDKTGCTVDGEPYKLEDWSGMQCDDEALTAGLRKNTCTKKVDNKTVTCVNVSGQFLANGNPITPANGSYIHVRFPEDYVAYGKTGDKCSAMTGADGSDFFKLAQLRCYAEAYWETSRSASGCIRRINPNWNAGTPGEFLQSDGPVKPDGQYIFEGFEYDSSTSGSFRSQERRFEGIQVGDNWDDCEVTESMTFSMRQVPDTSDLLAEMISESRNVSTKPACLAHYGDEGVQISKSIFLMKKQ